MPIEIAFRGVMLFVTERVPGPDKVVLDRILVPLATADTIPRDGDAAGDGEDYARHADATMARPHHAGIAVFRSGAEPRHVPLSAARVTIRPAGSTGARTDFPDRANLAPLGAITHANGSKGLKLVDDEAELRARSAAIVAIEGGTMAPSASALADSPHKWRFTKAFAAHSVDGSQLTAWMSWRTDADEVTIEIRTGDGDAPDETIVLRTGDEAYLYHLDVVVPTHDDLNEVEPTTPPYPMDRVDHDFKWLYQVLRPTSGTSLREWLAEGNFGKAGRRLPAPVYVEDDGGTLRLMRPNVSTCYPGSWP